MNRTPSIPEIAQRDRFIKRAVGQRVVYAVSGEDGLARVSSQRQEDAEVTLLWTQEAEAERWADAIAETPRVKELTIADLLADILPALPELKRLVGLDWSANPVEGEFNPLDIAERLRSEAVEGFVQRARTADKIFILEDATGPAMLVSGVDETKRFMPVWSDRRGAETRIEGLWAEMIALEIPLSNFLGLTLPCLAERDWNVGPDHVQGARTLELAPRDLSTRLSIRSAAA